MKHSGPCEKRLEATKHNWLLTAYPQNIVTGTKGKHPHVKCWQREQLVFNVCTVFLFIQDFSNDDTKLEYNVDADNGIAMEGYLFKRASNAFKTWNRYESQNTPHEYIYYYILWYGFVSL